MDVFRQIPPESGSADSGAPDPRLTPTPDYGTLEPNSDFAKLNGASSSAAPSSSGASSTSAISPASGAPSGNSAQNKGNLRRLQLVAALGGMLSALLVAGAGRIGNWEKIAELFSPSKKLPSSAGGFSDHSLDQQRAQKQVEILLARAVSRNDGASDQIQAHVAGWRGKIQWNAELSDLTTAALNSDDNSVRASAIEVQLAAYGLTKSPASVERLMPQAGSADHAQKIWALWALGLLGNRGVEGERVVETLSAQLKGVRRDPNEDSRRWAVEGLALVGTDSTIAPLLDAMHNDASPLVRERAACSLAESGMLTHEQRMTAVPQLIDYSDDPTLDAQTHAWAFQALSDITKQLLPRDSAAWREWYRRQ